MIEGLHHIAMICSDEKKALRFYCEGLGFTALSRQERPERHDTILMLSGYGMVIELFVDAAHPARIDQPEALGLRHLALKVTELEKIIQHMQDVGFQAEPIRHGFSDGRRLAFVKDPDGLPIELHE